jgi:hypothetical protein
MPRSLYRLCFALLALILALAACGSDDDSDSAPDTPTPTAITSPEPLVTLPPTWTPSPSPTAAATQTPVPTFTPRPTHTPTLAVTPGAVREGDAVRVIVLEADINTALQAVYAAQDSGTLAEPPVVTLGFAHGLSVSLHFYNDFLDRDSIVTTEALVEVVNGGLTLAEIPGVRDVTGAMVSDDALWAALALVEDGLNRAVQEQGGSAIHDRIADEAQIVPPGTLEVLFQPTPAAQG